MVDWFDLAPTKLLDLYHIKLNTTNDERGSFSRLFCLDEIHPWQGKQIVQVNRSTTRRAGIIRGLHFQGQPNQEAKFVICTQGVVFDVALDLRGNSQTFGQWFGIELDSEFPSAMLIPEGFAHGFQSLSSDVEMFYLHSAKYNKTSDTGINPFDREIDIKWPIACSFLSKKDRSLQSFEQFKEKLP